MESGVVRQRAPRREVRQNDGVLQGARPPPVGDADPKTPGGENQIAGQRACRAEVVISAHRVDRADPAELVQDGDIADVAGVDHRVTPRKGLKDAGAELLDELPHMAIGDHADLDARASAAQLRYRAAAAARSMPKSIRREIRAS